MPSRWPPAARRPARDPAEVTETRAFRFGSTKGCRQDACRPLNRPDVGKHGLFCNPERRGVAFSAGLAAASDEQQHRHHSAACPRSRTPRRRDGARRRSNCPATAHLAGECSCDLSALRHERVLCRRTTPLPASPQTSGLPIGHPGCCLDRRRERALVCLPPVVEGRSWISPSRRW